MIEFKEVSKIYEGGFKAIEHLNLHIKEGELLVLIGPSGCGKTTTMKMINKLIGFSSGDILIQGQSIRQKNSVELRRDIGYVIQQIGLFPHMTIAENVALVPQLKKQDPAIYQAKVASLLEMVGLDPNVYRDRYPKELSGGQQQRVGVIRALAAEPPIILMDEPFSALDPISREQLQNDLVSLQEEIKKTIVFVTHDMDEALKIADRICIMEGGKIVQIDTPENILRHPANEFVKTFIGEDRLLQNGGLGLQPVDELMSPAVTIKPQKGLAEAMKLLHKHKVDSLIVTDSKNQLLGVASAWDILKAYADESLKVEDIMKQDYALTKLGDTAEEALKAIQDTAMGYSIIVEPDKKVRGVVTNASLAGLLEKQV